jgi:hypothetical protein
MSNWIRGGLVVLAGALPATALLSLAYIPFAAAFSVMDEQPATALLVIGWFGLAATGTLALWIAPFRRFGALITTGLVAGLLAISPFWYFLIRDWFEGQSDLINVMNLMIAGPSLVATVLIVRLLSNAGK